MHGNAIYFYLTAKDLAHSMMEGKVMYGIATVEQSAVNIKEIGIRRIPAEARAHVSLGRGSRLVVTG